MDAQRLRAICVNVTTLAVLGAAVLSLQASFRGDATAAVQLILMAVILDGVDGAMARRWGVASALGAQLDSLADLAAFGVAPAFLVATTQLAPFPVIGGLLAIAFGAAGAFRLARFNVEGSRASYSGIPITVAAAILTPLALPSFHVQPVLISAAMLGLAFLMVSRVEYYGGKSERQRHLIAAAILLGLLWVNVEAAALFIGVFFLGYAAFGILMNAQRWLEQRVALGGSAGPR